MKQGPLGKFTDLLALYQALSLVVPMQPDLEIDPDLQVRNSITAYCTAGQIHFFVPLLIAILHKDQNP